MSKRAKIVVYTFLGVFILIEFFLLSRFILKLLGANPASPFSIFIYSFATILKVPFLGIFPNVELNDSDAGIDTVAITAAIGYLVSSLFIGAAVLAFVRAEKKREEKAKEENEKNS